MIAQPTFRALEASDLDAVHALNEAAIPAVNRVSVTQLSELNKMASQFVVANYDQVLAGFLILMAPGASYSSVNYQWFSARYARFLYVDRIVIDRQFHRRGIGHSFYARAWLAAQQQSAALTCEVNVIPPNPQSMAFHTQCGFSQVGRQHTDGGEKLVSLLAREP
ncbi:MAG: putative GNAT superfamily acetyltransferase [Gammaproteobacteria bacterium]|jgi:predicted GNAT superfamily acetyltransferase